MDLDDTQVGKKWVKVTFAARIFDCDAEDS